MALLNLKAIQIQEGPPRASPEFLTALVGGQCISLPQK